MNDWDPVKLLDLAIKLYGAAPVRKNPRKHLTAAAGVLAESKAMCDSSFGAELFARALQYEREMAALHAAPLVTWDEAWKKAPLAYARAEDFKKLVERFFDDYYSTIERQPGADSNNPVEWKAGRVKEKVASWRADGVPAGMIETLGLFREHGANYRKVLYERHGKKVSTGSE